MAFFIEENVKIIKRYVFILIIFIGLSSAYLVINYSSIFLFVLPLWALVIGFLSPSRKQGFLSGVVLFYSYTVAVTILMRPGFLANLSLYLFYYLFVFVLGGFLFSLIGAFASSAKKQFNAKAYAAMALTVLGIGLSIYFTMPESTYYTSIGLTSPQQEFEFLEIYLPMPYLMDTPHNMLFENYTKEKLTYTDPIEEAVLRNYSLRVEETEHGPVTVLRLNSLPKKIGPVYGGHFPDKYIYEGVVYLRRPGSYPVASPAYEKALKLQPRYSLRTFTKKTQEAVVIDGPPPASPNISFTEIPLPPSDWYEVTVFDVPVRVLSKPNASVEISMYIGSTDSRRISQGYRIIRTYSESFKVKLEPGTEWTRAEAQIGTATWVSGFGD